MTIVSNDTHSLNIIEERNGTALCEVDQIESGSPEKRFYVVKIDHDRGQVYDAIPADAPKSGRWFGRISAHGVAYVANARSYETARRWFNRLAA